MEVVRSTDRWPKREMLGLASQARWAATSASINIAEGLAKKRRRELCRYLDIANGSLSELFVIIRFVRDLNFIPTAEADQLEELRSKTSRLTWRLYEVTWDAAGRQRSQLERRTAPLSHHPTVPQMKRAPVSQGPLSCDSDAPSYIPDLVVSRVIMLSGFAMVSLIAIESCVTGIIAEESAAGVLAAFFSQAARATTTRARARTFFIRSPSGNRTSE